MRICSKHSKNSPRTFRRKVSANCPSIRVSGIVDGIVGNFPPESSILGLLTSLFLEITERVTSVGSSGRKGGKLHQFSPHIDDFSSAITQ